MKKSLVLLFILTMIITNVATSGPDDVVVFKDPILKRNVEDNLGFDNPTESDMLLLKSLDCSRDIENISGLEFAHNLRSLDLEYTCFSSLSPLAECTSLRKLNVMRNTNISSIRPLSSCENLEELNLHGCNISSISALSGLLFLEKLIIYDNRIMSVNPLAGLPNLEKLDLAQNFIYDVSALIGTMPSLRTIDLSENSLCDEDYCIYLPALHEEGIGVYYDENVKPPTGVTASDNIFPNQIEISWDDVCSGPDYKSYYRVSRACPPHIENKTAISDWQRSLCFVDTSVQPGIEYLYYIQTATSSLGQNAGDYSDAPDSGMAGRSSSFNIITVDDDAIDDPNKDGSPEHPFATIQSAIDIAPENATINVRPGTYMENIDFLNKNIHVTGRDPNNSDFPFIISKSVAPTITISNHQDSNCVLSGFTITGGSIGIDCNHSSPTITHCLITGNDGPGILCRSSNAVIINCTITGNVNGLICENSPVSVLNSILWNNNPQSIIVISNGSPLVNYSSIENAFSIPALQTGFGNIDIDPLFIDPGRWSDNHTPHNPNDDIWIIGDYHLQSQAGRWDITTQTWLQDDKTSPCIDAGDPTSPVNLELIPNGNRINMGAYGCTNKASKSPMD